MADYLFINEGKKEYLSTSDLYNKATKKGLFLADKCKNNGYNNDKCKQGLYCICQGENAKIKMTLFRRGDHVVVTSHHRIDNIRHMKGVCRHARDDNGKPYDNAYKIDDDGNPIYRIGEEINEENNLETKDKYVSIPKDVFNPDKKEMSPTEFIREILIECHHKSSQNKKPLTSKYFYGTLVNSIVDTGKNKGTFSELLNRGYLTTNKEYKDNKVIILGPVREIERRTSKNDIKINIITDSDKEKYILSDKEHYKTAADDFYKRYGINPDRAFLNYSIICFAITKYNSKTPMWLQFHLISIDGCYCDNLYEVKAYWYMNKFIKENTAFYYYKPFRPEGGDYVGESNLIPAAYLIRKDTGEKIAIIDIFDGTSPKIKERKIKGVRLQMIYYDVLSESDSWDKFWEKLSIIGKYYRFQ